MSENATDWYQKGEQAGKSGNYNECIRCWKKAAELFKKAGEELNVGITLYNIATVYRNQESYEEALEYYKQVLEIAEASEIKELETKCLNEIGNIYRNWSRYEEALEHYEQALEIARASGIKAEEARYLSNIGNIYKNWGRYEEALGYHEQSLEIVKRTPGIEEGEAVCLVNIGNIFDNWGRWQEALEHYEQALEINRVLERKEGEAACLNDIGILYFRWGRYEEALEYYEEALEIEKRVLGRKEGEARCLANIGVIYFKWGRFEEALEHFERALEINKARENKEGEAACLGNIGLIYESWERLEEALEYHEQALEIEKRVLGRKEGEAKCLNNIGGIYRKWSRWEEALKYFEQALDIERALEIKAVEAGTLGNIGIIYENWGRLKEALKYHEQALEINKTLGSKEGEAKCLSSIGNIYNKWGRLGEALEHYEQALEIFRALGSKKEEVRCLANIGLLFKERSNFSRAVEYLKESFVIGDYLASSAPSAAIRITARTEQQEILPELVSCLLSLDELITAVAYIEHNKGREMLLDQPTSRIKVDPAMSALIDQMNALDEKLQRLTQELALLKEQEERKVLGAKEVEQRRKELVRQQEELLQERKSLQQTLWRKFPTEGTLLPAEPEELVVEVSKQVGKDWLILDYYYSTFEEELLIFCLQGERTISVSRNPLTKEELEVLAKAAFEIIRLRRERATWQAAEELLAALGHKLHDTLVPPTLRTELKQRSFEFLTIIPTGVLHALPLELIHNGEDYWGMKYAMSRAFNLQTLRAAIAAQKTKRERLGLIIGDPTAEMKVPHKQVFGGANQHIISLGLKNAAPEAQELNDLLKQHNYKTDLLLKEQAQESKVIALLNKHPYSLIHYAGHAVFNVEKPDLSFLLLREGETVEKLFANELPAKAVLLGSPLVVFSACETGGVETRIGDEVFGFARGLIEAGAAGLLIAGWEVFDTSAAEFVQTFYQHYLQGAPLAASLQLARKYVHQRAVESKEELHYPEHKVCLLHWAAFRFYGPPSSRRA